MTIVNIRDATAWFQVLQTTHLSQTAVMTLPPGKKSSEEMDAHEKSDQILLVVAGEVRAEIGKERHDLRTGDVCLVPAGTQHRFKNTGKRPALTFNVYAPPEYPANEKD